MLQQTRVEAVVPYYQRFLDRFPTVEALAAAPEQDVLAAWSGLGYYSRARNLHRAAKQIVSTGFPRTYAAVLALPGAGPYTAAALASIALGLPHAAVDGNVIRVVSRLTNDASEISAPLARRRFAEAANLMLDPARPGDFNQAMMELGATVCVPVSPRCVECPVAPFCAAHLLGRERELPVRLKKQISRDVSMDLVLLEQTNRVFLIRRHSGERRLADFWELPEKKLFPRLRGRISGEFTHQIVNDRFRIAVWTARVPKTLPEGCWFAPEDLGSVPLATIARKALNTVLKIGI